VSAGSDAGHFAPFRFAPPAAFASFASTEVAVMRYSIALARPEADALSHDRRD